MFDLATLRLVTLTISAKLFLAAAILQALAQDCCDSNGPFTLGEGFPKAPATCETIAYWAPRAPEVAGRISFGITGELTSVKFDGALAYLTMCDTPGPQVLCVTYSTNGLKAGDKVAFAGGYNEAGGRVILDPCLASLE